MTKISHKITIAHELLVEYTIKVKNKVLYNEPVFVLPPEKIIIEFKPYKIKPYLRIDNILINYWLCDVLLYDHAIEFDLQDNFWQKYSERETNEQIKWVTEHHSNDPLALDRYVGRYDASEIIDQIKKNLYA